MDNDKTILGQMEAIKHIHTVRLYLVEMIKELDKRAREHDQSKLESPEKEIFGEFTPELAKVEYDSPKYRTLLEKVKPALDSHYKKNRHHPEWFEFHEEWKDVRGYEGYYEVSSSGRVRSVDRVCIRDTTGNVKRKSKILNLSLTPKGYLRVSLAKDGNHKQHLVHRLVAEAWIPNSENKPYVNHLNCKRDDNNYINLEWTTASGNLQYAYDDGNKVSNVKYVVHCKELDIVTIGINKMEKALRDRGYDKASSSSIWHCINNDIESHLDFHFDSYPISMFEPDSSVDKMTLIDLIEMLCDWTASSKRNLNGDITTSIVKNSIRFNIGSQLTQILHNTVREMFKD